MTMTEERKWIFYDSLSKTQSNPITSEEAQMAILKMKPKEWRRFFVWTTGWGSWQPLELFIKSDQTFFITQFSAKISDASTVKHTLKHTKIRDVLEMNKLSKKKHKEITKSYSGVAFDEDSHPGQSPNSWEQKNYDVDEMTWSDSKKPDVNFKKLQDKMKYGWRERRHELKIEILLISAKGNIFRSSSKNISLSGSLLEDNIPFDYYGVIFEIIILNRNAKLESHSRLKLNARSVGEGLTQRLSFFEMSDDQKKSLHALLEAYLEQQKDSDSKAS